MMIEDLQGVYKMRNQIQKLLDSDLSSLHISETNRSSTKHNTQNEKKRKIIRQYVIEKR